MLFIFGQAQLLSVIITDAYKMLLTNMNEVFKAVFNVNLKDIFR